MAKEEWAASPAEEKEDPCELETASEAPAIDEATNKALLKRIDRRVMPVVNLINRQVLSQGAMPKARPWLTYYS